MTAYQARLALILAGALGSASAANAAISIISTGAPDPSLPGRINFDNLPLGSGGGQASTLAGGVTVSFSPDGTDGQVVQGSVSGQYAAPYLTAGNGSGFGATDGFTGADETKYLTSGANTSSSATIIDFGLSQYAIGLLWGSVDLYNTLQFYNGADLVGSITGGQIIPGANGDQGPTGTVYVNLRSDDPFNRIVATSNGQYAFEIDNLAVVPEPSTYFAAALLGLPAVLGLSRATRRPRSQSAA